MIFNKNKRALSSIVVTMLLILLTITISGVLYSIIRPMVQNNLRKSEICLEMMDKVELSSLDTCYNLTSKKLFFLIDVKDTEVIDRLDIVISNNETQKSINLEKIPKKVDNLTYYDSSYYTVPGSVAMPNKKTGILYNYTWGGTSYPPVSIEMIPSSEGFTCSGSDLISQIPLCS